MGCIFFGIENPPVSCTKFISFLDKIRITLQKALAACTLNPYLPERFRKAVTVRYNLTKNNYSKKLRRPPTAEKYQKFKETKFQRIKVS